VQGPTNDDFTRYCIKSLTHNSSELCWLSFSVRFGCAASSRESTDFNVTNLMFPETRISPSSLLSCALFRRKVDPWRLEMYANTSTPCAENQHSHGARSIQRLQYVVNDYTESYDSNKNSKVRNATIVVLGILWKTRWVCFVSFSFVGHGFALQGSSPLHGFVQFFFNFLRNVRKQLAKRVVLYVERKT